MVLHCPVGQNRYGRAIAAAIPRFLGIKERAPQGLLTQSAELWNAGKQSQTWSGGLARTDGVAGGEPRLQGSRQTVELKAEKRDAVRTAIPGKSLLDCRVQRWMATHRSFQPCSPAGITAQHAEAFWNSDSQQRLFIEKRCTGWDKCTETL